MRWIALKGAVNVRDIGGLPTVEGSVTRGKRLLRSDNLQDLSPADIAVLVGEFGLTRVIDLRSIAEIRAEGPGPLMEFSSVDHAHHSMIPVETGPPVGDVQHLNDADASDTTRIVTAVLLAQRDRFAAPDPDDVVSGTYLGYLQDRPDSVVGALRAITGTPGAALMHCAAGKDRTGVMVALALTAVGVLREAVIDDYAATADRIEAILARLRASPTYSDSTNLIPDEQLRPRAAAMAKFLELVDHELGGVIHWLAQQGFGPEEVQTLRAKLVEAA